jgi:hypothetical protein
MRYDVTLTLFSKGKWFGEEKYTTVLPSHTNVFSLNNPTI